MKKGNSISASQEDYLEAIYHITSEKQAARAKDISRRLKVKNPSVTGALRILADKGMINYTPYDIVTLTRGGRRVAEDVIRKHEVLYDFFKRILGVDAMDAEEGACEVEHAVSPNVLEKLIKFVEYLDVCPRTGPDWIDSFKEYCRNGADLENCINCVSLRLEDLQKKKVKVMEEGKNILTLCELKQAQKGKIIKIKGRGEVLKQIVGMGFQPGIIVAAEQKDSDSGYMGVKIKGYHISIRKDDACRIIVEIL